MRVRHAPAQRGLQSANVHAVAIGKSASSAAASTPVPPPKQRCMKRTWGFSGSFLSSQNSACSRRMSLPRPPYGLAILSARTAAEFLPIKRLAMSFGLRTCGLFSMCSRISPLELRQSRCCAKVPQAATAALSSSLRILPRRTSIDAIFSRQFLFFAAADAAKNLPVLATIQAGHAPFQRSELGVNSPLDRKSPPRRRKNLDCLRASVRVWFFLSLRARLVSVSALASLAKGYGGFTGQWHTVGASALKSGVWRELPNFF